MEGNTEKHSAIEKGGHRETMEGGGGLMRVNRKGEKKYRKDVKWSGVGKKKIAGWKHKDLR